MTIELFIGLCLTLFIWLKNLYLILRYSDIYKIVRTNINKNDREYSDYQLYDKMFNLFSASYIFTMIEYEDNKIMSKTFYTLLGSSLKIKYQEEKYEIMSRFSPLYLSNVVIPLIFGIIFDLFGGLIFFHKKYFISYQHYMEYSAAIWFMLAFYLPLLWDSFISTFMEELQKVKEDNDISK